jgi:hypothetical protein
MIIRSRGLGNQIMLAVSVKRRGALLASNPSRNSRPELIADDEKGVILPARPFTWVGPTGGRQSTPTWGLVFVLATSDR